MMTFGEGVGKEGRLEVLYKYQMVKQRKVYSETTKDDNMLVDAPVIMSFDLQK